MQRLLWGCVLCFLVVLFSHASASTEDGSENPSFTLGRLRTAIQGGIPLSTGNPFSGRCQVEWIGDEVDGEKENFEENPTQLYFYLTKTAALIETTTAVVLLSEPYTSEEEQITQSITERLHWFTPATVFRQTITSKNHLKEDSFIWSFLTGLQVKPKSTTFAQDFKIILSRDLRRVLYVGWTEVESIFLKRAIACGV